MRLIACFVLICLIFLLFLVPAEAQFGGFNLPKDLPLPKGIPNPFGGGKNPTDLLQQQAKDYLSGAIAKELDADPPLLLDQHSAAPQAAPLDGFRPTKLTTTRDLNRPLPPGDYAVDVMFYCTKYSIHRGGQGVPYKLARAQGRLVRPMCTLLNRGSLQHINPATLNAEAWRMQDGLPLSQWPPADQALVHRLIPEYEDRLQGDFVQKMKHDYDSKFGFLLHKSFDDVLRMLGDPGEEVLKLEKGRQLLADQSIANDRLPDMLYQQAGEGGDPVLPGDGSSSPWAEIEPGVIGRFTNIGGYLQRNLLEMRVTSDAAQADAATPQNPTLAQIMGMDESQGPQGQTNLIAYPINQPSQDPLITPILGNASPNKDVDTGDPRPDGGVLTNEPINVANGNVYDAVTDYQSAGPNKLIFTRYYNSLGGDKIASQLGPKWRSTFDPYIQIASKTSVNAIRPDGQVLAFIQQGSDWRSESDARAKLTHSGTTWRLTTNDDSVETYIPPPSSIAGTIKTVANIAVLATTRARGGYTQTLHYDPVRGAGPFAELLSITDSYNRSLHFAYQGDLLSRVTTPDGLTISYNYDSSGVTPNVIDRLKSVVYSGSPQASLSYAYENAAFPLAATGVTDEDGALFTTWTYDGSGRALSNQLGQGAFAATIAYNSDGSRIVTDALGQIETYRFQTLQNKPKVIEIDRSATATTAAATQTFTYDGNGYMASQTDWNGSRTTYVNDSLGEPISITEAAGTPQARTTTITYQQGFHLPTKIVTPGLTTTLTYDADGNLLTKTLADTTAPTGTERTWAYTWLNGLLASVRSPRADVAGITRFTYDSSGTLASTTNALGQVTRVTQHMPGGLPLVVVDANGVTTKLAYDARQRLVSSTLMTAAGPLVTAYAYDPAGSLLTLTQPDGSALKSTYDAAHQLLSVGDALG